jgi:formylglycine-generating enzyme required for sulfatase activity
MRWKLVAARRPPANLERPPHEVTIAKPFAVAKYAVTFADWDACVAGSGCKGYKPNDRDWGRKPAAGSNRHSLAKRIERHRLTPHTSAPDLSLPTTMRAATREPRLPADNR